MGEETGGVGDIAARGEFGYYPVFLDVAGRRCVVVGGGEVAVRKVGALLDCGARVAVISPEMCEALRSLVEEGRAEAVGRKFKRGDLKGAFLVVAATSDECTNEDVAEEARSLGVLVNVADVPGLSSFIVPSCFRRGDVTVAVSSGGKSPALAKRIRRDLESVVGEEYGELCALVENVRSEVRERNVSAETWQRALEPQTATTLRDLMVEVVNNGTARCCMQLAGGIQAAAKTGTAQLNPEGQPPASHAWIIAFAPAEQPRYAVAVMVKATPEVTAGTGGTVAGPIAKTVLDAALALPEGT